MTRPDSFQRALPNPAAVVSDGLVAVPLWVVTAMSLSESFHLPALGSSGVRSALSTHDDTISLTALLIGPDRYTDKVLLEGLAEASKRGSALATVSGGRLSGLILVTALTIRTDMQVQSLSFAVSAARPDVLEVSMTLAHLPLPAGQVAARLLDVARLDVAALRSWERG